MTEYQKKIVEAALRSDANSLTKDKQDDRRQQMEFASIWCRKREEKDDNSKRLRGTDA